MPRGKWKAASDPKKQFLLQEYRMDRKGKGAVYRPVGSYGGIGGLSLPAREDARLGQLKLVCLLEFKRLLAAYTSEYKKRETPGKEATLEGLAPALFNAYIRYLRVAVLKGTAKAKAIQEGLRGNENSQAMGFFEEPRFFGMFTQTYEFPIEDITVKENQFVNTIVEDHPDVAATFGLTHSGANSGPAVNMDAVVAKIAAGPDAAEFTLKERGQAAPGTFFGMGSVREEPEGNGGGAGAAAAGRGSVAAGRGSAPAGRGSGGSGGTGSANGGNGMRGGRRRGSRKQRKSRKGGRKGTRRH